MSNIKELEEQLKKIGCNFRFWGRAELRELANVLLPGELVRICVNGQYEGGFAMLVATDQRVLLIDKKPMYLTLEDVRFDMVAEVDYTHRLLDATIFIRTPNKALRFTAYNQGRLRTLFHLVQTQVMEIRQHYQEQGQMWKQYAASIEAKEQGVLPIATEPQKVTEPAATAVGQAESPPQEALPAIPIQPPPMPPGFRTVSPIVSAYTRLPIMSRSRRFLGSRAINSPMLTTLYSGQQPR